MNKDGHRVNLGMSRKSENDLMLFIPIAMLWDYIVTIYVYLKIVKTSVALSCVTAASGLS